MTTDDLRILWLQPSTGEHVSNRRQLIASHLEQHGYSVTIRDIDLRSTFTGVRELLFGSYDVVIANVRYPLYLSYPIAALRRRPFIADVSDPISQIAHLPRPLFKLLSTYEWWILKRADAAVFAESRSYSEAIESGVNATLAKNAVDYELFANPTAEVIEHARDELHAAGVDFDAPIVIYPGRLSETYHMTEMLDAAKLTTEWEFVFLGERGNQEAVEQAAERTENVHYLGSSDHEFMPGFFHFASAGLCLVDEERPLKLLEFGAAGIPVLGIEGNLEKEFSDGELWFIEPTPANIVQGLDQIQEDGDEATSRSNSLKAVAEQEQWKSVAEQYLSVIKEATG